MMRTVLLVLLAIGVAARSSSSTQLAKHVRASVHHAKINEMTSQLSRDIDNLEAAVGGHSLEEAPVPVDMDNLTPEARTELSRLFHGDPLEDYISNLPFLKQFVIQQYLTDNEINCFGHAFGANDFVAPAPIDLAVYQIVQNQLGEFAFYFTEANPVFEPQRFDPAVVLPDKPLAQQQGLTRVLTQMGKINADGVLVGILDIEDENDQSQFAGGLIRENILTKANFVGNEQTGDFAAYSNYVVSQPARVNSCTFVNELWTAVNDAVAEPPKPAHVARRVGAAGDTYESMFIDFPNKIGVVIRHASSDLLGGRGRVAYRKVVMANRRQ